jgi:GT2 family glycosyltransferase
MSRTLIGISSFGGIQFLEITLREIQHTVKSDNVSLFVIVAKPNDHEMCSFLEARGIPHKMDTENRGFASNINDAYDRAFTHGDYDHLIICGNDVVPMSGAIDAMIKTADETEWEMVCGSEFNSRFLVNNYEEAKQYFHGENLVFTDFLARPWELHKERRYGIEPHARKDIRNLTLFKRSAFEKVGYADVAFYPNAYYEDDQFCARCDHLGVSACGLAEAAFFHFWSRTIHQNASRDHGKYFERNGEYFEKWKKNPVWKISSRDGETQTIQYWASK